MNKANFNQTGGFPLETDTLDFMQNAYGVFNAVSDLSGHLTILKGCHTTGAQVSDGVVSINGEVLEFKGGSLGPNVMITEEITNKIFEDGVSKPVFTRRYVTFSTAAGSFAWSDFKRIFTIQRLGDEVLSKATNTSVEALTTRISLVEKLLSPITGRGRIWWTGTLQQLETECPGWVEDTDWRYRFPFHWEPNKAPYNDLNQMGGEEFVRLEAIHNGPHSHSLSMKYTGYRHGDSGTKYTPIGEISQYLVSERTGTTNSSGSGIPHNNMPPYKLGMWIKYIG